MAAFVALAWSFLGSLPVKDMKTKTYVDSRFADYKLRPYRCTCHPSSGILPACSGFGALQKRTNDAYLISWERLLSRYSMVSNRQDAS